MLLVSGTTINDTINRSFQAVKHLGAESPSRNGSVKQLFDVTFQILDPYSRHLHLEGRKSNIFQLIAETFWVMAGASQIKPYLSFFLPRAGNYSDDGETWHGAYGPRMYAYNQIADAINDFKEDGINTRRSTITISDLQSDSKAAAEYLYGEGYKLKDKPCNREIHFYVDNGKFCAKTIQRSGDLLFGAGSINPFEFTFLQELMFNEVKKIHPDLELGHYAWHVTNAHVYSEFESQVDAVLTTPQTTLNLSNQKRLFAPDHTEWCDFFGSIVLIFSSLIEEQDIENEDVQKSYLDELVELMSEYKLNIIDNLIWDYIELTYNYILAKRLPNNIIKKNTVLDYRSADLNYAVVHSQFRKFLVEG